MKTLLTALSSLVFLSGCVSNRAYLYEPVKTKQFKIEIIAENESVKGIFENAIKAELLKAGYAIKPDSDYTIKIIVFHADRAAWLTAKHFVNSVSVCLQDSAGNIYIQSDYSQSANAVAWWGDQTPIEIARRTAQAFVKKIKSS